MLAIVMILPQAHEQLFTSHALAGFQCARSCQLTMGRGQDRHADACCLRVYVHGSGPEETGFQRGRSCLHASVFGVAAYLGETVVLQHSSDADHTVADKDQNEASLRT